MIGAAIGQQAGTIAGQWLARSATRDAERDPDDQYAFRLCQMIAASTLLKAPLVERYLQIATEECSFNPEWVPRMVNSDWDLLYRCNNGVSGEAREIMLHLIRINQGTCFGIEMLGRSMARTRDYAPARPGRRSIPPFDRTGDPYCDNRSPGDIWSSFLSERERL